MHFDARTQRALREAGARHGRDCGGIRPSRRTGRRGRRQPPGVLRAGGTLLLRHGDGHSATERQEHATADVDLFTHGSDLRGYLSLEGWGVPIEGGRVLRTAETGGDDEEGDNDETPVLVELSLGATVHDRVRFARDPDEL